MRPILFLPLSLTWLILPACGKKNAPAAQVPPPAAVSVLPAASETISITRQLPGRLNAVRVAEVRARVSGILLKRTFEEGAEVKAGDVLFQIDPEPLEAARDNAAASLARAEANLRQAETSVTRYRDLSKTNAVSRQSLDDAEAAFQVASAEILSAKASLKTAELNLGYASVTAPIDGRIGRAQVTEGALVGENEATLLAVIQQLDPIYFDFTQSSTELMALRRAVESGALGKVSEAQAATKLVLEDGSEYEHTGKLLFSEVSVDESTGMVSLRAEFPNPDRLLLPGMFARIRIVQAVKENAVTIPQRAVTRGKAGKGSVLVVDDQNTVQLRQIETDDAIDGKWVVTSGLKAGEKVVIEGHMKAPPGSSVVPEPFVAETDTPNKG